MHKHPSYLMKNLLLFAALSVSVALNAQHYYDDIIGTQEI